MVDGQVRGVTEQNAIVAGGNLQRPIIFFLWFALGGQQWKNSSKSLNSKLFQVNFCMWELWFCFVWMCWVLFSARETFSGHRDVIRNFGSVPDQNPGYVWDTLIGDSSRAGPKLNFGTCPYQAFCVASSRCVTAEQRKYLKSKLDTTLFWQSLRQRAAHLPPSAHACGDCHFRQEFLTSVFQDLKQGDKEKLSWKEGSEQFRAIYWLANWVLSWILLFQKMHVRSNWDCHFWMIRRWSTFDR